ncbi:MAG: DUF2283 domain-containing protein [Chloroflexota bacterium]|nr:DUF2283 domain-containing protein [Chloroflexota bacterium]
MMISTAYDPQSDILTFAFTATPQPALAEEAADDIWVRYDVKTHEVITVDVLNFSSRLHAAFGPALIYDERTTPDRLQELSALQLPG